MKYVIIGNSAAAVGCVEGIRQVDQNGGITIVSRNRITSIPARSSPICSAERRTNSV